MDRRAKEILDSLDILLGKDVEGLDLDVELDEGIKEKKKEGIWQKIRKQVNIVLFGKDGGVEYPFSDRLKYFFLWIGIFMVVSALESMIARAISSKFGHFGPELSLRIFFSNAITTIAETVEMSILFLLNHKILALAIGVLIVVLIARRK